MTNGASASLSKKTPATGAPVATNTNKTKEGAAVAARAPAPAPAKRMMFPKQAAAQAAQEARQQASGERPPPTTDSWDNEPVVVSGYVWRG